jgi:CRISPR-associated exonuclease Cas4
MLGVAVPAGALFYGRTRRRFNVHFDDALRRLTEETTQRLHSLIASGRTPLAQREPKCDSCSLLNYCLPDALKPRLSATRFFERSVAKSLAGAGPLEKDW